MGRPLRFGVLTAPHGDWPTLAAWWRRFESLGFDSAWVADQFVNPFHPERDWFEGWTTLAALATQTSRIRIGTLVAAAPFHNPAFLARQCMTIDQISDGRLEIGLGAGSVHDPSYAMTGIENYAPAERVARLRETIKIVDRLLRERVSSYDGAHYSVADAVMNPGPRQLPRPPLVVAAHGPAAMRVAARLADGWNSYLSGTVTLKQAVDEVRKRNVVMDRLCAEAGRNPVEVRRTLLLYCAPEPNIFLSLSAFEDAIHRFAEAGMEEIILTYPPEDIYGAAVTNAMFERLAVEALPRLREV